jgi:hypothetical protein
VACIWWISPQKKISRKACKPFQCCWNHKARKHVLPFWEGGRTYAREKLATKFKLMRACVSNNETIHSSLTHKYTDQYLPWQGSPPINTVH